MESLAAPLWGFNYIQGTERLFVTGLASTWWEERTSKVPWQGHPPHKRMFRAVETVGPM